MAIPDGSGLRISGTLRLSALGSWTGCGVRVAIIDSGVHAAHPHVQGVAGGVGIDSYGLEHSDLVDRLGHGTAVTAVIREKAPAADLFAIKVFDRELSTTSDALVSALRWTREHRIHLVNLSLGTVNPASEDALQRELHAARSSGIVVVAAGPQDDVRWLPGSLSGAIAIHVDMTLARDTCEVTIGADGTIAMRACGYPRPIPGVPPERNLKGLSFAVANASGLLARVMEGIPPDASVGVALADKIGFLVGRGL